jgi:DNA repair protein RecN (Recombination protein N)
VGEDRALAEALFQAPPGSPASQKLAEWGIRAENGEILVKREFSRSSGKTRSFINGEMATASMVAEVGDLLIDIHGQHEHQAIFNAGRHRRLVDASGRLEPSLKEVEKAAQKLNELLTEQSRMGGDSREIARRVDLLRFQAREIGQAALAEVNEEELLGKFQSFKHAGKITQRLEEAQGMLDSGGEGGASGLLGRAVSRLQDAAKMDPSLDALCENARTLQESLNQLSFDLARKMEGYSFGEGEFQELSDRIDLLNTLKKKYGDTLGEVLKYFEGIQEELKSLEGREERQKTLGAEIEKASADYEKAARDLSRRRLRAGESLTAQTGEFFKELGLAHAKISVLVTPQGSEGSPVVVEGKPLLVSPLGWDKVEFLFSANPGEPLRPLAKVASGGEASRVMLALKTALAESDDVPTLIFDEIDTGVGARTAPAVGRLLQSLSGSKQLLCVSHLAPIAGLGEWHYQVAKSVEKGRTSTRVHRIADAERIEELAKMLGGEPVSETSRSHAMELYAKMRSSR